MLGKTSLHAIDGAPADFQSSVDSGGIYPCFQKLDDLLLNVGILLATTRHDDGVWRRSLSVVPQVVLVPGVSGARSWHWLEKALGEMALARFGPGAFLWTWIIVINCYIYIIVATKVTSRRHEKYVLHPTSQIRQSPSSRLPSGLF